MDLPVIRRACNQTDRRGTVAQLNLAIGVFGNNGDRIGFDQRVEICGLLAKLLLRFAALGKSLIKHEETAERTVL